MTARRSLLLLTLLPVLAACGEPGPGEFPTKAHVNPGTLTDTEILPPARPEPRASVRMRGAVHCDATGYWSYPYETTDLAKVSPQFLNVTSLELVGPRARPHWTIQVQWPEPRVPRTAPHSATVTVRPTRYAVPTRFHAKAGEPGWNVEVLDEGYQLELDLVLPGAPGEDELRCRARIVIPKPRPPTPAPAAVREILERLAGGSARPFSSYDYGHGRDPECLSVLLEEDRAYEVLPALRRALPEGWIAFVGNDRWLDDRDQQGTELVVAPGNGWQDIVRVARVRPVNHGLTAESVLRQLVEYEKHLEIELVGAAVDWVGFRIRGDFADAEDLANDLIEFCPDFLQSVSRDELVDQLEKLAWEEVLVCWWD